MPVAAPHAVALSAVPLARVRASIGTQKRAVPIFRHPESRPSFRWASTAALALLALTFLALPASAATTGAAVLASTALKQTLKVLVIDTAIIGFVTGALHEAAGKKPWERGVLGDSIGSGILGALVGAAAAYVVGLPLVAFVQFFTLKIVPSSQALMHGGIIAAALAAWIMTRDTYLIKRFPLRRFWPYALPFALLTAAPPILLFFTTLFIPLKFPGLPGLVSALLLGLSSLLLFSFPYGKGGADLEKRPLELQKEYLSFYTLVVGAQVLILLATLTFSLPAFFTWIGIAVAAALLYYQSLWNRDS